MQKCWYTALWIALMVITTPSLAALDANATQRLQRAVADMTQELTQVDRDIQRERQRLDKAELALDSNTITAAVLEDARLELASFRSRESGLNTRMQARHALLEQLQTEIIETQTRIQRGNEDETNLSEWREQLKQLQEQQTILKQLIDKLESLHQRFETRSTLARQRLDLLQARFELPDLEAVRRSPGKEGKKLQQQIDQLLASASEARRVAAGLGQETPQQNAQRRLLDLQALDAEERAEFHQLSIARLQIERVMRSLVVISGSRSTPVRVLKSALHNLQRMREELQRQQILVTLKHTQLLDQRNIVQQQGAITSGADSTHIARINLIDQLIEIANEQIKEITALDKRVTKSLEEFTTAVTTNAGMELTTQRTLPTDLQSWRQLTHSLMLLPLRVGIALKLAANNYINAFMHSSLGTRVLCCALFALFLIGFWQIRRWLLQRLDQADTRSDSDVTDSWSSVTILHRNLFGLLIPLFILTTGLLLKLRQADLILLMAPLLIWPVVKLSLAFINNLLDEYTPELDPNKTRLLVLETRWVVILAAVLAAALVTAHTVALSPAIIDVIDRLSMICLLLIALPLLHLRKLLLEGIQGDIRSRMLRGFSIAIPVVLIICAIIGISGYVNLAWAIAIRIGWLMLVGLGVHIVRSVLRGLLRSTNRWFQRRDAESAPYWNQYILGPFYRVTVLLVVLAAAQLLFYLYNWNAQTPIVRAVPLMLDSTLFSIGETAIKLKTLGLALLALFVAIWGAGWSKQVSYRWLYTGVQDQGIRSSLSTFTQYFVVVLGLVAAMKIIGLDLTALTVFAGALGVGIGFGMQTIVVNFISGILLLVERPLATTDLVNVDKYEGEVTRIGIRSLTVKTFDNQEVIIPNSAVITKPFTNWTRSDDIMRTVLMIGISYDDDPHQAVTLITELVKAHTAVLADPGPKVLLWEYGDSALLIRVQFHTRIRGPIGRADTRSQLLFSIWDTFKQAGITIPYPQRDVHMRTVE